MLFFYPLVMNFQNKKFLNLIKKNKILKNKLNQGDERPIL